MNKISLISLLAVTILLTNCGGENVDSSKKDVTAETADSTIVLEDTLVEVEEVKLFNIYPEVNLVTTDADSDVKYPNLFYYKGKINDQSIEIALKQDPYSLDRYIGQVFNNKKGHTYSLVGKMNYSTDTLELKSLSDSGNVVKINAVFDRPTKSFKGVWMFKGVKTKFTFQKVNSTPVQREVFTYLADFHGFYNTTEGLVAERTDNIFFNDFTYRSIYGEGYDFSSLDVEKEQFVNFIGDEPVFTEVTVENMEGTKFKEGHGPSGIDDTDYIVEGQFAECNLIFTYKWLENGVFVEDYFEMHEDFLCTSWNFRDKFVIMKHDIKTDKTEMLYIFYWDNDLKEYVRK